MTLLDLKDTWIGSGRQRCHSSSVGYAEMRDLSRQKNASVGSKRLSLVPALAMDQAKILLDQIEARATDGDEEDLIDFIYSEIDALLRSASFAIVDDLLGLVDTSKLTVVHLLAFASITIAAQGELRQRAAYVTRLRRYLEANDPERVEDLLAGLE